MLSTVEKAAAKRGSLVSHPTLYRGFDCLSPREEASRRKGIAKMARVSVAERKRRRAAREGRRGG